MPQCRDTKEPSFWQTLNARWRFKKNPSPKQVAWRIPVTQTTGVTPTSEIEPQFACLSPDEVIRLKQLAQVRGVSVASLMLATLNQTVFQLCLAPYSQAWWFYPVNVRGAVNGPAQSNLSSGFYLCLDADSSAESIHALVKDTLSAQEHWWLWKMAHIGRWIGNVGVRYLYRRISRSHFYLGSFSYVGDWSLPQHPNLIIGACGAGSANYPIATGMTECNGYLSMALKFHPSIAAAHSHPNTSGRHEMHSAIQQQCLLRWQHNVRSLFDHG